MADLNKIDEKVVAHLESLDLKTDLFSDSVKILENKLSKQLSEYLSTFELDKGNLVLNNANISKLGALQVEIEKALKDIEKQGLRLVPLCPFVAGYIHKHPEWKRIVMKGIHIQ